MPMALSNYKVEDEWKDCREADKEFVCEFINCILRATKN